MRQWCDQAFSVFQKLDILPIELLTNESDSSTDWIAASNIWREKTNSDNELKWKRVKIDFVPGPVVW